jgi:transcription elongation factor Elf1
MEQMTELMMEHLLAIMADIKASQEQMTAKMDAHHERAETNMNAWQNKMKAYPEAMDAYPERMEARTETDQEPMEAKIKTGLVEVDAMDLEDNPEEKSS